jgi:hypothetical protein
VVGSSFRRDSRQIVHSSSEPQSDGWRGVVKPAIRVRRVSSEGAPSRCATWFLGIVVMIEDMLLNWMC